MNEKYIIILFKNKSRYKIIKSYKTFNNANNFFQKKLKESSETIFEIRTEKGKEVSYEIALLEKNPKKITPIFKTDEFGRNIPIVSDDVEYGILKIENYNLPEKVFHVNSKRKIPVESLVNIYLKSNSLKLVSKLNNKIIIQKDNEFNLFSLKSEEDAERFLKNLESYMIKNDKRNCLIVKDIDSIQKKYLYEMLNNIGYSKKMLYRKTTTHPTNK